MDGEYDTSVWDPSGPSAPPEDPVTAASPHPRRGVVLAGLALLLAVAVVGVVAATRGGDGSGRLTSQKGDGRPAPAAALAAAPAATQAERTARLRTTLRSVEDGIPSNEVVEGVIGFGGTGYDLTYSADGSGPLPVPAPSGSNLERVFSDGTTVWTTVPPDVGSLSPGLLGAKAANPFREKKFLATKVGAPEDQLGADAGAVTPGPLGFSIGAAPTDVLAYLTNVATAALEGPEQIDGEDTARYGVGFDLDALQRALPSEQRSFDAYDFKPDVPHTVPAKVWLDRSGRLRKLTYRLDLGGLLTDVALKADYAIEDCSEPDAALITKAGAGDRKAKATLAAFKETCTSRPPRPEELVVEGSVELSSYGTPLTIVPPPAREVVTSEQLDTFFTSQAGALFTGGAPAPSGSAPAPAPLRPRTASTGRATKVP